MRTRTAFEAVPACAAEPGTPGAADATGAAAADGAASTGAASARPPVCYRLRTPLTFATVAALRPRGVHLLQVHRDLVFDLRQIEHVDSAGLALLVDWLAQARRLRRRLRYQQLPAGLLALAKLSEVQALLEGSSPAP